MKLTKIDYLDLLKKPTSSFNINEEIEKSLATGGQCGLIIKNMPNLHKIRTTQLKNIFDVYKLPKAEKEKIVIDNLIGWCDKIPKYVYGNDNNGTNAFMWSIPNRYER